MQLQFRHSCIGIGPHALGVKGNMGCQDCEKLKRQVKDLQKGADHRRRRNQKYKELMRRWRSEYEAQIEKLNQKCHDLNKRIYEIRKGKHE